MIIVSANDPVLLISPEVLGRIEAQAAAEYAQETCGLLLGREEDVGVLRAVRLCPAVNVDPEDKFHRYRVDREAYEEAERIAAREGLKILGVYHSHPDSEPIPSPVDTEYAFPGWIYWIVRVDKGRPGEARAWLRVWSDSAWRELEIVHR